MKKFVLALALSVVACTPAEPRIPATPPATLPRVDLDPVPPKTSLLDEVECGMSVAEVEAVLRRLALSPLRQTEPGAYVSETDGIEVRIRFRDGRLDGAQVLDATQGAGTECGSITSPH